MNVYYITTVRVHARDTPWPFKIDPDREFEFDPGTVLIMDEPPKMYYNNNNVMAKFRIQGGTKYYFIRLNKFRKYTIMLHQ